MRHLTKIFGAIVLLTLLSCSSSADRRFEFSYTTDFMVNEFEIFEGVPATLANINFGDALNEKLKSEGTSLEKLHDVKLSKVIISINDSLITFADLNNFKLEAVGKGEKATMRTIGNINDADQSLKTVELLVTGEDLIHYLKDSGLLFVVSGEGKRDIEDAFGMKIEMTFDIGVKN
ncbi:MAG: hypothetical protein ACK4GL_03265 [Flavobacteriales bacterium]